MSSSDQERRGHSSQSWLQAIGHRMIGLVGLSRFSDKTCWLAPDTTRSGPNPSRDPPISFNSMESSGLPSPKSSRQMEIFGMMPEIPSGSSGTLCWSARATMIRQEMTEGLSGCTRPESPARKKWPQTGVPGMYWVPVLRQTVSPQWWEHPTTMLVRTRIKARSMSSSETDTHGHSRPS